VSHYEHHIPGRLRIRSAAVKKNKAKADAVEALLAEAPGVRSSEISTLTGSIVVNYDPALTSGPAITTMLRERGYFTHYPVAPRAQDDFGSQFAKKLATYALETALERSVVGLVGALL
jgi:copper chaperone CopZ